MIDIDRPSRPLDPNTALVWNRRIFKVEPVGCVICTSDDEPSTVSSQDHEGRWLFYCCSHGWLVEIPFSVQKHFVLRVGELEPRIGDERLDDTVLVPADLTAEERNALLAQMLDDAECQEHEDGPAPSD